MTENESRLTKRNPDGSVGINDFRYYNYADFQKLANKLAEFEDIGTVEELIKEHKELIELSRKYLIDTNELLEYQAIGTVEQLKAIKQWKSDVMEGFCKYDASSFEEIVVNARAKAIDEFAENIVGYLESYERAVKNNRYAFIDVYRIAERMKGRWKG
jgi:hypothetical protein